MEDISFVLNTLWLLVAGALVMWMAAGFTMLEAGLTRSRNNVSILTKNVANYALACMVFYAVGYGIMFAPGNALLGFGWGLSGFVDEGHSRMAGFFFQMVFVATASSIVSGAVAERMRFWPFVLFVCVLSAVIYPIQGHWSWGGSALGGWLEGFRDFAGSTVVHSVGGWAALSGVWLLGPRMGKYPPEGGIRPIPGHNMPMATLGVFILWLGWLGFNGGSQLSLSTLEDAQVVSRVIVNTNLAASAGVLLMLLATQLRFGRVDLSMVLNGALGGLVAITAGPEYPSPLLAMGIGAVGAGIVFLAIPLLDRLRLDDPVGAIPVHLGAGIWGTLAVGLFHPEGSVWVQLKGIVLIGLFVGLSSLCVWWILRRLIGLRVGEAAERHGVDVEEFGLLAYPEQPR